MQAGILLVVLVNIIMGAGALLFNKRDSRLGAAGSDEQQAANGLRVASAAAGRPQDGVRDLAADADADAARAAVRAAERALEVRNTTAARPHVEAVAAATLSALSALGKRGRTGAPPPSDSMVKVPLDLGRFPTAVCNDGSPGAYYITEARGHKGHPAAPHVWLVFLQGGGWCWDAASCAARHANEPGLMSSDSFPPVRDATGIFSPDPALSPFATANKVYVPYCSSDAFVGNVGKDPGGAWHFRGQDLVKATLDALQRRASSPLAAGHAVYFGGCSAGGRGALFNYEYLPELLPKGVRQYGIFDSVMWVDGNAPAVPCTRRPCPKSETRNPNPENPSTLSCRSTIARPSLSLRASVVVFALVVFAVVVFAVV